jgi:hypothetical protein
LFFLRKRKQPSNTFSLAEVSPLETLSLCLGRDLKNGVDSIVVDLIDVRKKKKSKNILYKKVKKFALK